MLWMDQVSEIPADLLALQSNLEELHLYVHGITVWPNHLLTSTPHLRRLTLDARSLQEVPDSFLADIPQLTALTLWVDQLRLLPKDTLAQAPRSQQIGCVGTAPLGLARPFPGSSTPTDGPSHADQWCKRGCLRTCWKRQITWSTLFWKATI